RFAATRDRHFRKGHLQHELLRFDAEKPPARRRQHRFQFPNASEYFDRPDDATDSRKISNDTGTVDRAVIRRGIHRFSSAAPSLSRTALIRKVSSNEEEKLACIQSRKPRIPLARFTCR